MIETRPDGSRWSNRCDLCRSSREAPGAREAGVPPDFMYQGWPIVECPWCRSVRLAYGSYWYPITKSNEHLFRHKATQDAEGEEMIHYKAVRNAIVDQEGRQIAVVLASGCTRRLACEMAAYAAQQANHALRDKARRAEQKAPDTIASPTADKEQP